MQRLGEQLRHLREHNRMSLRHVAAKANITAAYLSDIELGRRHPSDRVLADLARALRTPVDELRQHDPKAVLNEIEHRMEMDSRYAVGLRRLLKRCATADDLMRIVDG